MPVYEYYCRSCQTRFEVLRPISRGEEPAACPSGHEGATRVMSTFISLSKVADGSPPVQMAAGGCAACAGGHCATCSPR